jgi:hypothetical protein
VSGSAGKAQGKGRGGKRAARPGAEPVADGAASAAVDPLVGENAISHSTASSASAPVSVTSCGSVAGASLLRPRVRGLTGRGGVDGVRRGDMSEILAENEYVDEELRRRGFQLHGGQWIGGQVLPGEPSDVNLAERFLREQYELRRVGDGTPSWGEGRRLGQ